MVCYDPDVDRRPRATYRSPSVLTKPPPPASPDLEKPHAARSKRRPKASREIVPGPTTASSLSSSFCLETSFHMDRESHALSSSSSLLRDLAANLIGRNAPFASPFGRKAQVYADYTASGKSLACIERFLRRHVMPTYGNTHTTTSVTGLQTTSFRDEARQIIAHAVNAHDATDVVLFAGQGCTSAIHKLVTALGVHDGRRRRRAAKRPVVFTCPFAHHSNLLPWRESPCADEVPIPEAAHGGGLDLVELERQLQRHQHRPLKIGSFAAASNLTGLLLDVDRVSKLLHKYNALACWDYATCAPYVPMDMNPKHDPAAYKDAIFFSGHKFVGGPGSPGVLVVKKAVVSRAAVPTMPGGGTVLFVSEKAHRYLKDPVEREEGGTPDILGAIRLGLAFQLKQRVGPRRILALERRHVRRVRASLGRNAHIVLLGRQTDDVDQLPIFSMLFRFHDRFLHHNFVCALLNDLFGVQARGGCQCAGPFGARLLGLRRHHILDIGRAVLDKHEILKPGVARLSFPYFADAAEVDYVLAAVHFVADHGWKFLPQYRFSCRTGGWRHASRADVALPDKKHLSEMQIEDATTAATASGGANPIADVAAHRRLNLEQAAKWGDLSIEEAAKSVFREPGERVADCYEGLRWFAYPSEAVASFQDRGAKPRLTSEISGPCQPQRYFEAAIHHEWDGVPTLAYMKRHRVRMTAQMLLARYCIPGQGSPYLIDMTSVTDSDGDSDSDDGGGQ
ncbi:unnamed protein product [Hyaloperonospora brassicae]|uniref:Aminotransferase class V domain-containing protein n=1 Tax=Hyaloperonospora brassicae TaxID=162125 RepID=A0AAV0US20_HYABA|nr:unnamed protein product [Hyaloperonospora brassicae]